MSYLNLDKSNKKGKPMEISAKEYSVNYDAQTATICWQGFMRLSRDEYEPIEQLLDKVITFKLSKITLDLRKLKAINSSGITMLGKFVLAVNEKKTTQLLVKASKQIAWQKRSVENFRRLMQDLPVEWETAVICSNK
jgi:hypothetical protein